MNLNTIDDKRFYLIQQLIKENQTLQPITIPSNKEDQERLLRALMNIRQPKPCSSQVQKIQDEYLSQVLLEKGLTDLSDIPCEFDQIRVWKGDITTLRCDAIVNACNRGLSGCYHPLHGCIDNCIHTFAGMQLRFLCNEIIKKQGHLEETGNAKITPAFNLPSRYIFHTVGPIIQQAVRTEDEEALASCYRSCLLLAQRHHIKSIAFCCISTGEFHFPNEEAAMIAIRTVKAFQKQSNDKIEVIFNVFHDKDYEIYKRLLSKADGIETKDSRS